MAEKQMTEEQKHAQAEFEKALDTLSEDELDALAGGKVTDDVKKFFQSEKGKQVLKYTAIIGTPVVTIGAAVGITAGLILHKKKKANAKSHEGYEELPDADADNEAVWNGTYSPPGINTGDDSAQ